MLAFGHERYTRSALVDVDGDGALDLVLLAEDHNPYSTILLNDGRGYFTELANALPPKPFGANAIGIAIQRVELNGDNHPDLLLGYTKGNPWYVGRWIQIAVNNGDGTFRDESASRLPQQDNSLDWPYEIVLGDLNGDAFLDFAIDIGSRFCCPGTMPTPPFYLNRGDGTFEELPATAFAQAPYGQLRLIDVNRDGALDVFGAWQSGWDRREWYAVQVQNDDDGDGVPNAADRCPRHAGEGGNGCPAATLTRVGDVWTARARRRGIGLRAGVEASCPPVGFVCRLRGALAGVPARPRRKAGASRPLGLRSRVLKIKSGVTASVSFVLSRRAAKFLRKAGRVKVKLTLAITGPDLRRVTLTRRATIRPPR